MTEQCFLCSFWQDGRCIQTFRLVVHIEPIAGIGGQVDFQTTPGMVPEELKPQIIEYFRRFLEKVLPAISMMPFWDEIRKFQLNSEERTACPGRRERADIKPFLKIVR